MIKVYSTPTCAYCHKVRELFKTHGVSYEEIDLVGNPEAQKAMIAASGQMGVPVTDFNGTIVIGYNKVELEKLINSLQK
jgi:glutaredoxin-like YruB-family protein